MRESKFKKEFREFLTEHGCRVHPIENKIVIGMPDLLVIKKGSEPIWVEVKTKTQLRVSQALWAKLHPEEAILMISRQRDHIRLVRYDHETTSWKELYDGDWEEGKAMNLISIILGQMN